jgi:exopolysaccharide production protein ExoZ
MNSSNSRKKLGLIQGFRGVAALLVVMVHSTALLEMATNKPFLGRLFGFGGVGVDFFFVLSGFIIYYVNYRDVGKPEKARSFLLKRFLRVYPLYWVVLIPRLLRPWEAYDGWIILSSLTLFPYPTPPIVNVSWTLTYEVFFYLIFSLFILRPTKWLVGGLLMWLTIIVGYWILYFFGFYRDLIQYPVLKFFLNSLHLEFVLGSAAAYLAMRYRWKHSRRLIGLGVLLLLGFGLLDNHIGSLSQTARLTLSSVADIGGEPITRCYRVIFAGIPSMIIVLGSAALESVEDLRLPRWFTYLGDASFSIYLIHGSVINNTIQLLLKLDQMPLLNHLAFRLLLIIAAIGSGCLMHELIEKRLLKWSRHQWLFPAKPD